MAVLGLLAGLIPSVLSMARTGLKNIFSKKTADLVGSAVGKFAGKAADFGLNYGLYRATNASLTGAQREANEFTASQNNKAMAFEQQMADRQMAFQADQAATQWQRGVADMQAANLNPALAYGQGGASAMSGSSGSGFAGSSVSPIDNMSSLLQMSLLDEQRAKLHAETKKAEAEVSKIDKETGWIDKLNSATVREKNAAVRLALSEAGLNENERKALLAAQKVLAQKQGESLDRAAFYENWRNEYIKMTGSSPESSALTQLYESTLQGLNDIVTDIQDATRSRSKSSDPGSQQPLIFDKERGRAYINPFPPGRVYRNAPNRKATARNTRRPSPSGGAR